MAMTVLRLLKPGDTGDNELPGTYWIWTKANAKTWDNNTHKSVQAGDWLSGEQLCRKCADGWLVLMDKNSMSQQCALATSSRPQASYEGNQETVNRLSEPFVWYLWDLIWSTESSSGLPSKTRKLTNWSEFSGGRLWMDVQWQEHREERLQH